MASSTEERSQILYPVTTPDDSDQLPAVPSTGQSDVATMMYPSQKAARVGNPYAINPDSVENKLYGATEAMYLGGDTEELITQLADGDEKAQEAWTASLGYLGAALSASQGDMRLIVHEALVARMVGAPDMDERAILRDLINKHGSAQAEKKLDDTKELLSSFPDVNSMLRASGLGNSPSIIKLFMRLADTPSGELRLRRIREKGVKK